jgi:hypothetical protein
LTFLLPIFHQEILDQGAVHERIHESLVNEILNRLPSQSFPLLPGFAPPAPSAHHTPGGGQGGRSSSGFVGRPTSASVVGSDLALLTGVRPPPLCPACPGGRHHESYECPRRYARLLRDPCPGFDALGNHLPAAWSGSTLTATARASWQAYILRHDLLRSKHVTADVAF